MFRPSNHTSPAVGVSRPATILPVVVLPHPDSPTRQMTSPGSIAIETRSTARTTCLLDPKCRDTPRRSISGGRGPWPFCVTTIGAPSRRPGPGGGGDALRAALDLLPADAGRLVRRTDVVER